MAAYGIAITSRESKELDNAVTYVTVFEAEERSYKNVLLYTSKLEKYKMSEFV